MNAIAENIKQRLSLRQPLQEALDILVHLSEQLELQKDIDVVAALDTVSKLYPTCTDFERAFPSICFSIATGVGKTRLMGACVAYLFLQKGIRNFFILAPNLTIYNKLIEDFDNTSNPKYVFRGITEFVHNKPIIITGDNYTQQSDLFREQEVRINIFNVSKFARETKPVKEGGKNMTPRIKRLSEYLGQSYWDYLSNLDDLVILMDEAHRYHADKSKEAINELQPILGIELTATPIDEKSNQFRNVVYEYSLAKALTDGLYVKNPTIATRKDFNAQGKSDEEIEKIKLEDAVSIHEDTKQALKLYALNSGKKLVKPFILIVCKDTTHAKAVYEFVSSVDFYNGDFAGKVLQIDSTTRNEEAIEQQFISLEQDANEIEIVIHVNMLKEGWDVTNLYTIVPLRAANASVLVEQTIGRGLRLPFNGERTGNDKVDKLTVVAHDNFTRVIEAANDPNSILNKMNFVEIEVTQLLERQEVITVQSTMASNIAKEQEVVNQIADATKKQKQQNIVDGKKALVQMIPFFNTNSSVKKVEDLLKPEVKQQVLEAVKKDLNTGQGNLFATQIIEEATIIYDTLVADFKNNLIEIPRMTLLQGEVTASFNDFDLASEEFSYEQLNEEIMRIGLKDKIVDVIEVKSGVRFDNPIKLLVSELINFPEIDYDSNADLLHKLAKQAVDVLKTKLKAGEEIGRLVFQWRKLIATRIYNQMMVHFELHEPDYIKPNVMPFTRIENWNFSTLKNDGTKDYREDNFPAIQVPKFVFRGFEKSCHFEYKFDSRTEQNLAYIFENDKAVLKWLRPAPNQFRIYWKHGSRIYEPDFVAETADCIYIIEAKAANEVTDEDVLAKAKAAIQYCNNATDYTAEFGGKPWKYALVPHDQVSRTSSFKGVVSVNVKK
jgi:type III restriction enzyme